MTPEEERGFVARRNARSAAIGIVLALFALLFFAVTIARMQH